MLIFSTHWIIGTDDDRKRWLRLMPKIDNDLIKPIIKGIEKGKEERIILKQQTSGKDCFIEVHTKSAVHFTI